MLDGRLAVGAMAIAMAGSDSVRVEVTARAADSRVYAVRVQINGGITDYMVTATCPAGGGAPTYTVMATPT